MITVYFDNSCPICREEIGALKSIDTHNRLALIDCSVENFTDAAATQAGLTQNALKQALHVRDAHGQWHSAVDAFVVMYDAVGFDSAVRLLQKSGVRKLFNWIYPVFVKHRHKLTFTGAHKLMPWLIRRTAKKQSAKAAACAPRANSGID
jgi:predicted DCC family thiol-disulfide oxidoreductase YuxK